jgi:macrolide transport system ATP-binding/permease protein
MISAATLDLLPRTVGETSTAEEVRAPEARPLLRTAGLTRTYGSQAASVTALQDVDLAVHPGEFVVVFGRSGSGKSTLLSLLGLLDLPTRGHCLFGERDSSAMAPDERALLRTHEIGFVFQHAHLLPRYTAQENVELALVYAGVEPAERSRRAGEALAAVGLDERRHHKPAELSGGEQQRVALARAIVNRPALLLADEPTGALDTHTGREVMELLRRLNDAGQTIVMVTHEVELARYADRAVVMRDGLVLEEMQVREGKQGEAPPRAEQRQRPAQSRSARLQEALLSAWRALRTTPVRSLLTALGVVVGIAAVIAMVAIGDGARRQVADQIASLGTNLLLVLPGSTEKQGVSLGLGSRPSLTQDDAEAIARQVAGVAVAAPTVSGTVQVVHGNENWATLLGGVVPDYLAARDWHIAWGESFGDSDVRDAAKVALLGTTVAERLFGADDPVDQTIRIGKTPFRVTGVLAAKGQNAASGRDQDDVVLIPLTTAKLRILGRSGIDRRSVDFIVLKSQDGEMDALTDGVTHLLRQRHRIMPDAEDDFVLRDPAAALNARDDSLQSLTLLLLAVAGVALVVGGIGIMNIMLVSTVERRSEIALRLAIGATRGDIRNQFLIEASTLCLLGSVAGVVVGFGAAEVIAWLSGWQVLVRPEVVVLAIGFACLIGVFFGWYPAQKAARMDAIHYELG